MQFPEINFIVISSKKKILEDLYEKLIIWKKMFICVDSLKIFMKY